MKNSFKWKNKTWKTVKNSSLSRTKNVRKKFETPRCLDLLANRALSNPTSWTQALMASTKLGEAYRETEISTRILRAELRLRASILGRRSTLWWTTLSKCRNQWLISGRKCSSGTWLAARSGHRPSTRLRTSSRAKEATWILAIVWSKEAINNPW